MIKTFKEYGRALKSAKFNPNKLPFEECYEGRHYACSLLGISMAQGELWGTYDCGCICHETG